VDIDGVLADYAGGYMAWIEKESGIQLERPFPSGQDFYAWIAKQVGSVRSEELKHRYRETGGKLDLPVLPGACSMLKWLRSTGLYIAIVSARP
jgi:phosphoserine phosphatase